MVLSALWVLAGCFSLALLVYGPKDLWVRYPWLPHPKIRLKQSDLPHSRLSRRPICGRC